MAQIEWRQAFQRIGSPGRIGIAALGFAVAIAGRVDRLAAEEDHAKAVAAAERIETPAVENLYRLSPKIYSGAQPEGEAGFEALERLGVRTIISVDGASPDVEGARQRGMRYVHVPIGYDGVPATQAMKLIKAARELPGPVFVHCHHGKHRGPAAAAVCAMAVARWSRERAEGWMKVAGTAADYRGLFQSVKSLRIPTEAESSRTAMELPEQAAVSTLVEIMVEVERDWDRLKALRETGYLKPRDENEPTAQQAALQLAERFRELSRAGSSKTYGRDFASAVHEARDAANTLEQSLSQLSRSDTKADREQAEAAFSRVAKSCKTCHKAFRDAIPIR